MKPAVEATPVKTQSALFAYPGGAEVVLVHVLEVGDGADPKPPAAVKAVRGPRGVEVSVGGETYSFETDAPYRVTAGRAK